MIRTQEMVPDYYIEKSRDFQILCRLYDFIQNPVKYNTDTILNNTNTLKVKDTILPLVGDKFGINDKEAVTNRELLEALPNALQSKGSLKAVKTLIHAFLDSLNIFDYASAFYTTDEESAKKVSAILRREIKPYSIVIVLSSMPSMTNINIFDTYLRMVIPTGMIVEYMFGLTKNIVDKYKYSEHVFLFYTHTDESGYPLESNVANSKDHYYSTADTSASHFEDKVISNITINQVGGSDVNKKQGGKK